MLPGLIKFIKRYIHEMILGLLVLVIVGPTIYCLMPFVPFSPDILYVKAKVMWVLRGDIFADPVTGLDTMHPPFFHLFLAPFVAAGIDINVVMALTSVLVVVLIFFFTYKIVSGQFDRTTAFWTCLMLPFIVEFMGPRNILLATAFYFSVPFYLAGLWVYLKSPPSLRTAVGSGVLWGLAFLISPVFLFLIGLTYIYEAVFTRRYRRLVVMVGAFAVTLIPFYIQLYAVYSRGLGGAATFALWRGIPDWDWLRAFIIEFIAPTYHGILSFSGLAHIAILLVAVILLIRTKELYWYLPIALLAYVLTFYHFSGQYAIRIQLFFSIFLVAWIVHRFQRNRPSRLASGAAVLILALFAGYHVTDEAVTAYRLDMPLIANEVRLGRLIEKLLPAYIEKDSYIICDFDVYRLFIMPFYPVHALGCYRSLDYFQLPQEIADELQSDYQSIENSENYVRIDSIARKYNITKAVIHAAQTDSPLFATLETHWATAYRGPYFTILEKKE